MVLPHETYLDEVGACLFILEIETYAGRSELGGFTNGSITLWKSKNVP